MDPAMPKIQPRAEHRVVVHKDSRRSARWTIRFAARSIGGNPVEICENLWSAVWIFPRAGGRRGSGDREGLSISPEIPR